MKLLVLDQYEFEPSDSEQSLIFACSHQEHFSNLEMFFRATGSLSVFGEHLINLPGSIPLSSVTAKLRLAKTLSEFCDVVLRGDEQFHVVHEAWNLNDYVFMQEHSYMRYRWSTSA